MDAFLHKAQNINTIKEAEALLWESIPSVLPNTLKAYELSLKAHAGQVRKSGEPYIVHPILVAAITSNISQDQTMVQAALLHDVVEDTGYVIEDIEEMFGDDVAHLVEGLTKITEIRDEELISSSSDDRLLNSALSFRKMLIASIKDVRVLVIKLCDRVHNMLTLDALKSEKQKRIAQETLVVYAPIAHRLGISRLKNHLEDLSFKYIYPEDYAKIDHYICSNEQNLNYKLSAFIQQVKEYMLDDGFVEENFEIIGRVKHYYSIYMKMHRKGVSIEEVLDLLAIRIVVNDPIACYRVLGLLHLEYTPLISRFKDYISVPKENGYQTIHTTLFSKDGIVEAQIRTLEMHRLAEYGIASHWKYKNGGKDVNLSWLDSLHYQHESVEEFYELAKSDLFSEDITVFSPKGDYYTLPKGSVALDFAYAIHSEVGECATEALVNKEKTTLLHVLKNGDIVNINKDSKVHLHCSWIDSVKTSKAKESIKSACKTRIKEIDILSAYNILGTLFSLRAKDIEALVVNNVAFSSTIYKLATKLDYYKETIHQVAALRGTKELHFWQFLKKGYKKPLLKKLERFTFFTNKPLDGVEFDYCCHPKNGDQIIAFYKDNRAIVHHKMCKKAYEKIIQKESMLFVSWSEVRLSRYRLIISLQNRQGVLADLLAKLSLFDLNVLSIELGIQNSEQAEYCKIEVESSQNNKNILADKIRQKFKLIDIINLDDAYNK